MMKEASHAMPPSKAPSSTTHQPRWDDEEDAIGGTLSSLEAVSLDTTEHDARKRNSMHPPHAYSASLVKGVPEKVTESGRESGSFEREQLDRARVPYESANLRSSRQIGYLLSIVRWATYNRLLEPPAPP